MTLRIPSLVIASMLSCTFITVSPARAQCVSWTPDFSRPGTDTTIHALCTFDDGSGPALYVGGEFTVASGLRCSLIARWNGARWSPVGGGMGARGDFSQVSALVTFDDGQGDALYAAGTFESAGGIACHSIAKWNGTNWSPIVGDFPFAGITALTTFDDGTGSALYATSGNAILRWHGNTWSQVGTAAGWTQEVLLMAGFDDGTGPALYVSGSFESVDGVLADSAARLRAGSWEAVGISGGAFIQSFAAFDDGSGPRLYAGGGFFDASNVMHSLGRWNGSQWTALGPNSTAGYMRALTVFDPGTGPLLFGCLDSGTLAGDVVRWDGQQFSLLGASVRGVATALASFDSASGPMLFLAGGIREAGGALVANIAEWNGSTWSTLGPAHGSGGVDSEVHALTVFDDGTGPSLYAAGPDVHGASGVDAHGVVRWNGSRWTSLGRGPTTDPQALLVFDDGSGSKLYAGGSTTEGAAEVERWNGSSWSMVGTSLSSYPLAGDELNALAAFDDGTGPALFAGGKFTTQSLDTIPISKWDGSHWSSTSGTMGGLVRALTVFDDGSGPALYACGLLQLGTPCCVAKWNGASWSALGGTLTPVPQTMTVFDDGTGSALYVGGRIDHSNGVPFGGSAQVVRWNGAQWLPIGPLSTDAQPDHAAAFSVFDDGSGSSLYVGGWHFNPETGLQNGQVANWNGASWSSLSDALNGVVKTLGVFDSGSGPELYAGGAFSTSGRYVAGHVARLRACR